jgi:hypothetical protein
VARSIAWTQLPINVLRRPIRSMTLHVQRCDVICLDPVVGSFGGGRTRTPSSIGSSTRLNGQGCMNSISMTYTILLSRGCSNPEWSISLSKKFSAIGCPEPATCISMIGICGYVMRSTRLAILTEQKLCEEIGAKKQEKAFQVPLEVPPSYLELIQNRVSSEKVVPRDRIELSTPAFSGLCSTN